MKSAAHGLGNWNGADREDIMCIYVETKLSKGMANGVH